MAGDGEISTWSKKCTGRECHLRPPSHRLLAEAGLESYAPKGGRVSFPRWTQLTLEGPDHLTGAPEEMQDQVSICM